jgi:hypothetical protein
VEPRPPDDVGRPLSWQQVVAREVTNLERSRWTCRPGNRCHSRTCDHCHEGWGRDWYRVGRTNLALVAGEVGFVTVTAPGADVLPWDEHHCAHHGPHGHSGKRGCRIDHHALRRWHDTFPRRWRRIHQAAKRRADRHHGRRSILMKATEPQQRGAWHLHLVYDATTPADRRWLAAYVTGLRALARHHGFGMVDFQTMPATIAASYCVGYLTGKGSKEERSALWLARQPLAPTRPLYVGLHLTRRTGTTMRNVRASRQLYAVRRLTGPGEWVHLRHFCHRNADRLNAIHRITRERNANRHAATGPP